MAGVIETWRDTRAAATRDIVTVDDYAMALSNLYSDAAVAWGFGPQENSWRYEPAERISHSFEGYAMQLCEGDGAVAAIVGVRVLAFSLVRFSFQRMRNGRPAGLFGMPNLNLLERPYLGGTTQDLLMRMMQDVDLAGNAYVTRAIGLAGPELVRLRPDWVQIILMPITTPGGEIIGYRRVGYTYHEGGIELCPPEQVALFDVREVAHWAPDPDPGARYRGQSWLTAVIREIVNDKMMEKHKTKFWENAATPNISVALSDQVTPSQFAEFKAKMELDHRGVDNAYKTLFLGGGADVKVIGANLAQIDFASIQGRTETRMCARAGVPPIIVGFSEGLSSSTYSNYGLAMRRFGDLTMASLWANAAGSLETLVPPPGNDARLWYDARDVAFLRDDAKARADVAAAQASTISSYITSGFTPESAVEAADAEDPTLLVHTGLVSVQLQPPGQAAPNAAGSGDGGGTDGTNPATNGTKPAVSTTKSAPPTDAELPETGELDAVDRQLHLSGAHPHPRLAQTNGGS
jgi:phage portal protein BeeE